MTNDFFTSVFLYFGNQLVSGHLATLKGAGLTLRESAQCPKEDEKAFQDRECGMVHQSSSWDHTKHIPWWELIMVFPGKN